MCLTHWYGEFAVAISGDWIPYLPKHTGEMEAAQLGVQSPYITFGEAENPLSVVCPAIAGPSAFLNLLDILRISTDLSSPCSIGLPDVAYFHCHDCQRHNVHEK